MIVFLSCVKSKRKESCMAQDMYISDLFSKSFAYAKSLNPRRIYILSAKYGLLELTDKIVPYEKTLVGATKADCKRWAYMVYNQMLKKGIDFNEEAVFLCGENYRKYLMQKFPKGVAPLEGLPIGKQLAWYKSKIEK